MADKEDKRTNKKSKETEQSVSDIRRSTDTKDDNQEESSKAAEEKATKKEAQKKAEQDDSKSVKESESTASSKIVDKTREPKKAKVAKEMVEISGRERRLRERLLTVDEDLTRDELRLRRKSEAKKRRLTRQINQARQKQEDKLNRRDNSKLYHKLPVLYYLLCPFFALGRLIAVPFRKLSGYRKKQNARRFNPHRSFYLTTHAKSVRQINISGYGHFVGEVWRFIRDNWKVYLRVLVLLFIVVFVITGVRTSDNSSYESTKEAMKKAGVSDITQTASLFTQAVTSSLSSSSTNQQLTDLVLIVLSWLVLIYLARHIYGGRSNIRLRDAIFNSAGPLISELVILLVMLVQLLPLAFALISYSAASGASYINDGTAIENMAAFVVIALIVILTIYWMITSIISLITVTIPGIYPLRAYFETSILVAGRRVKILLRILMMFVPLAVLWLVVLVPVVAIDSHFNLNMPMLVQAVAVLLVAVSLIWISVYMYMFYRRLLDSPEQPEGTPNWHINWPWLKWKKQRKYRVAKPGKN